MNKTTVMIVAAVLAAAGAALYFWNERSAVPERTSITDAAPPAPTAAPAEAPVRHPVEPLADEAAPTKEPLPSLDQSDAQVRAALLDWLGSERVQTFLQLDNFIRHVVATVDNLGRAHAAPRLWPVNPMPGRFSVEPAGDRLFATPGNAERYAMFVAFVESLDTGRAVALYRHGYPLFQQAYEELGYPGRYFNDRLVEVIDLLIATPVPAGPVELKLTEVKGPIPSTRPWVRYEFADPSLEALAAGQKMMLRVGPAQQQRLKAKLIDLRTRLTASRPAR